MNGTGFDLAIETQPSFRERVYEHLKAAILSGRLPPGQRLVETRIAAEAGVSRTPVREALHVLAMEGLLETGPRSGYRVRGLRWEEVEEICEIRAVNEVLAARWAAVRITPEELERLRAILALAERELECSPSEGFAARIAELDAEFHETLVGASRSPRLLELCRGLRRHVLIYRLESVSTASVVRVAVAGHRKILDRLEAADESGLEAVIREHVMSHKAVLRDFFASRGS